MRRLRCSVTMAIMLCVISAPVFGQDQSAEKKKESTVSDVKTADKEAAKTTGTFLYQKKEQYQKKAEEKLRRFENNVKRLYARAEKKSEKAREKIAHAADELRNKGESAKNRLKDLKDSGEEKWESARAELDSMLKDLEHSYNRTVEKIKD